MMWNAGKFEKQSTYSNHFTCYVHIGFIWVHNIYRACDAIRAAAFVNTNCRYLKKNVNQIVCFNKWPHQLGNNFSEEKILSLWRNENYY